MRACITVHAWPYTSNNMITLHVTGLLACRHVAKNGVPSTWAARCSWPGDKCSGCDMCTDPDVRSAMHAKKVQLCQWHQQRTAAHSPEAGAPASIHTCEDLVSETPVQQSAANWAQLYKEQASMHVLSTCAGVLVLTLGCLGWLVFPNLPVEWGTALC